MKKQLLIVVVAVLLIPAVALSQTDRRAEVDKLSAGIKSVSRTQRVNAAKLISRSGLQDQGLYEKIAQILKAGYGLPHEKDHADEMSWMCKALAASGDAQYKALLDEIAAKSPSMKIKRYAKQSSELLEQYAQRSAILNATENWDEGLSAEDNRLLNMLQSNDIGLRRDAAKMVVRNVGVDAKVFNAVAQTLKSMDTDFRNDTVYVDCMAWLCKALAASGNREYVDVLENLDSATQNIKVTTYVKKAISALQ